MKVTRRTTWEDCGRASRGDWTAWVWAISPIVVSVLWNGVIGLVMLHLVVLGEALAFFLIVPILALAFTLFTAVTFVIPGFRRGRRGEFHPNP